MPSPVKCADDQFQRQIARFHFCDHQFYKRMFTWQSGSQPKGQLIFKIGYLGAPIPAGLGRWCVPWGSVDQGTTPQNTEHTEYTNSRGYFHS